MERPPVCPAKLEKLLVCTDGSGDSQGAVAGALALARSCGSKLFLFQVMEFNAELEAQAPDYIAQRESLVRRYLEQHRAEAERLDIPVETRVRRCESASQGIVDEALKVKPDLIVMGRRGRGRLFRLMLGNVTARVIGHSPCNVLVVPKGVPLEFRQILIASDGSPHSYAAWDEALAMARRLHCELLALSAAREDSDLDTARAIVKRLKTEAGCQGVTLKTLVSTGAPYEAIVKAAMEHRADLIVMGALGTTTLTSLIMGSTTERVIATAPCCVMVVKAVFG
jgi:hypothetical protein